MPLAGFTLGETQRLRGTPGAERLRDRRRVGGGGTGFRVNTTRPSREGVQPTEPTAEELMQAFLDAQAARGSGGGGLSLSDQLALLREEARLGAQESLLSRQASIAEAQRERTAAAEAAEKQRLFQKQQEAARLEEDRRQKMASLKAQRQQTFVDLLGRDPVRAVLFAMGIGPEADKFNTQAQSLGGTISPLAGAEKSETRTESALSKLLGGGRSVDIGKAGVTGLGTARRAARSFQEADVTGKGLLTSAFGVGSTAEGQQPGISAEALLEQIEEVTPTGALR